MWVLRYPKGSAFELLDGTLKLRHCTEVLPCSFTLGLCPGLVMGVVQGSLFLLIISWMKVVMRVKESGQPGRHIQVHFSSHSGPRASNAEEMECSLSSEGVGSEVGEPRNLFPRLGVG